MILQIVLVPLVLAQGAMALEDQARVDIRRALHAAQLSYMGDASEVGKLIHPDFDALTAAVVPSPRQGNLRVVPWVSGTVTLQGAAQARQYLRTLHKGFDRVDSWTLELVEIRSIDAKQDVEAVWRLEAVGVVGSQAIAHRATFQGIWRTHGEGRRLVRTRLLAGVTRVGIEAVESAPPSGNPNTTTKPGAKSLAWLLAGVVAALTAVAVTVRSRRRSPG